MAKRKTKAEGDEAVAIEGPGMDEAVGTPEASEPAREMAPVPTPKVRKTKKLAAETNDVTLEDVAAGYLRHLEDTGRSAGTALSYRLELATALDVLGAQTKLAELTPARVLDYFVGDRVMKTRSGAPKAEPSWRKSRRVLRLALVWAQESKMIERAPVPEEGAVY